MRTIDLFRHSHRAEGADHLSREGVELARVMGGDPFGFDVVYSNPAPRCVETAVAMGYAVDTIIHPPLTEADWLELQDVLPRGATWGQIRRAFADDPRAARLSEALREQCLEMVESVPEDGRALAILPGGYLDYMAMACLEEVHPSLLELTLGRMDGFRLRYYGGHFIGGTYLHLDRQRHPAASAQGESQPAGDGKAGAGDEQPLVRRFVAGQPLTCLHAVGVRYRGAGQATRRATVLEDLTFDGIIGDAGVRFRYHEPKVRLASLPRQEMLRLGPICAEIAVPIYEAAEQGHAVFMTGGDCRHAVAMLAGLQWAHGAGTRIGLVWMDAHGDFNTTRTTTSGDLGGMPVAVMAGLTCGIWRDQAGVLAPIPTDRIAFVGPRNLDIPETVMIASSDAQIVSLTPGGRGVPLDRALDSLVDRCDMLYLHVDADIVDASLVPNHVTKEPNGPSQEEVERAIDQVMATGLVAGFAVVSIHGEGEGREESVRSGFGLLRCGVKSWARHGMAQSPLLPLETPLVRPL